MMTKDSSRAISGIVGYRLNNQQIINTKIRKPSELTAWLGAVQAQDYYGAKWSLALRLNGLTDDDIEQAIDKRTIIRSWPLRGTLHFTAAEDIRWMLTLMAPRIIKNSSLRNRSLELDEKVFARSNAVFEKQLSGRKELIREELTDLLKNAGIIADGVRLYHIIQHAALNQIICYGKRRGKQFTYTLLDEWIPQTRSLERDEALFELARRYFFSRGPAALKDFIWWSGLNTSEARKALEMVKPQLTNIIINENSYWMPQNSPTPNEKLKEVFLLPGFDEYLIGYKDRSAIMENKHVKLMNSGNGMLSPTIIINGRIAGIWKRILKKNKAEISATLFLKLSKRETEALNLAAARYADFLKMSSSSLACTVVNP